MIDWGQVAELRDVVDEEELHDLVELFLDEVGEILSRLGPGATPASVENDLHFLKGSAVTLGFTGLARLCAEGERAVRTGGVAALDANGLRAGWIASKERFVADLDRHVRSSLAGAPETAYGAPADTSPESAACPHQGPPRKRSFLPTRAASTPRSS